VESGKHLSEQGSQESTPEPDPFPLLLDWTQCPDCFGDERLTLEERTFKYARPSVRNDHFDDEHLEERERAGRLLCKHPKCKEVRLESLDHFRNHVKQVHKVSLRTSQQAVTKSQVAVRKWQVAGVVFGVLHRFRSRPNLIRLVYL